MRQDWESAISGCPSSGSASSRSLITMIGLAEGDTLEYLETHGATALRTLTRELPWPSPIVTMAVGALIREGLARGTRKSRFGGYRRRL